MSARFRNRKMKQKRTRRSRRSQTTVSLPYEVLESRIVLSAADFGLAGGVLTLDNFDMGGLEISGPATVMIGDVNHGILVDDAATGTGYIMYSQESVHDRFLSAHPLNADHLIAVRFNGSDWQYNTNFGWKDFTAVASDRLVAAVDFDLDTVMSLEGTNSVVEGVNAGYVSGDLVITPDEWNGGIPNDGEFWVTGTSFDTPTVSFQLSAGTWDGVDSAEAFASGSDTLIVSSTVDRVFINDSLAQVVDVNFMEVDLSSFGDGFQLTDVNDVTDSGAITLNYLGFTSVNSIDLDHSDNDFDTIAGSSDGSIYITDADDLTVGAINGVSGITTSNDNVKLTTGGDLALDESVNLGTGSLYLSVMDGNVTQMEAIAASGLGLMVTGNTTLKHEDNNVSIIAADNGGTTYFTNDTDLVVGSVTVNGMSLTGMLGDDTKLTVNGNLTINENIDLGPVGDLFLDVSGSVVQGLGAMDLIHAHALGLMVDGTTTLQNSMNEISWLAANNGGQTLFTNMVGLGIGSVTVDLMTVTGLTTTDDNVKLMTGGDLNFDEGVDLSGGDLFLDVDGNVAQSASIIVDGLGTMVTGTTTLDDANNEITTIAGDNTGESIVRSSVQTTVNTVTVDGMTVTGITSGSDFELRVDADVNILEAIDVGANELMLLGFDITQADNGTIWAGQLSLFAGTAILDLGNDVDGLNGRLNTDGAFTSLFNDIDDLTITALMGFDTALISDHDLKLIIGDGIGHDLQIDDEVEVDGNLFLDVGGNITQTAAVEADGLGLMVDGTTTLQHANNDVGVFAGDNVGNTFFTNDTNLFVDSISVDGMTVPGITTNNADVKLTVNGILAIVQPIAIGTGDLFLHVTGSVLQSEPITADGLGLIVGGTTTLQKFNNDVNTIAADNSDNTYFTDNDGLQVGAVTVDGWMVEGLQTGGGDAKLIAGDDLQINSSINLGTGNLFLMVDGNLTQTAPLMADEFGMMVTGDTTLEDPDNDVNIIAEDNLGATSYVDANDFEAGTVTVDGMTVSGFETAAPMINVQGNLMDIGDGDMSPSLSDGTDFGSVAVDSSDSQDFVIMNNGTADLILTGTPNVSITGDHAADFVVTMQPGSPISGPGSDSFEITFTPSAEGLREATVTIDNNDDDANPYTFDIQGTGTITSNEIVEKFEGETNVFSGNLNGFQTVSVGSNTVLQSPATTQFANTTIDPPLAEGVTTITTMDISAEVTLTPSNGSLLYSNGYVVFDYVNQNNYKVAGIEAKNQLWVIGQVFNGVYTRLASVFDSSLTQTQTRTIDITVTNNLVTLMPDPPPGGGSAVGPLTLSGSNFLFNGSGELSEIGLGTVLAGSQFDCFMVVTDPDT